MMLLAIYSSVIQRRARPGLAGLRPHTEGGRVLIFETLLPVAWISRGVSHVNARSTVNWNF